MTPCEKLGYRVGDDFEVNNSFHGLEPGDRATLFEDDGTGCPLFSGDKCTLNNANGKPGAFLPLAWVSPLAITLRPGDYVSTDGITEDEYHAVAAAFMAAGARPLEYPNLIEMREQLFFGWAVRPCGEVKGLWHSGNLIFHRDGRHLTINQVLNATNAPGKPPQKEPTPMNTIDTLHEAKRQRDEAAEKLETAEAVLSVALDAVQTELGVGFIIKEAGDSDFAERTLDRMRCGEDMNDPANWRAGDVVRATKHSIDTTEGREYVIAGIDHDGHVINIKDDAGDVEGRWPEDFTFVRRP